MQWQTPPATARDTGSIPVREDPTCCGETRPKRPHLLRPALEPGSHKNRAPHMLTPEAHVPGLWSRLTEPGCLQPVPGNARPGRSPCTAAKSSPALLQLEKACLEQPRPSPKYIISKRPKKPTKKPRMQYSHSDF